MVIRGLEAAVAAPAKPNVATAMLEAMTAMIVERSLGRIGLRQYFSATCELISFPLLSICLDFSDWTTFTISHVGDYGVLDSVSSTTYDSNSDG
jgi:hypothetical protein